MSNRGDPGDIPIPTDGPVSIIWAIGKMAEVSHRVKEPSFHHTYTRQHTEIDFTSKEKVNTCFPFTSNRKETFTPWNINPIFNPTKRSFSARLGPAGGKRGYRYISSEQIKTVTCLQAKSDFCLSANK